jgi:hypothetical protein
MGFVGTQWFVLKDHIGKKTYRILIPQNSFIFYLLQRWPNSTRVGVGLSYFGNVRRVHVNAYNYLGV